MRKTHMCFLAMLCVICLLLPSAAMGDMRVYYAKTNRLYNEVLPYYQQTDLVLTGFQDADALDRQWRLDYASGDVPDVLLLDESTTLPVRMISAQGAFYDLSDFLQTDPTFSPANYVMPVVDAGFVEGRQSFLPFGFSLAHAFTTAEKLYAYHIALDNETSLQDFMAIIEENRADTLRTEDVPILFNSLRAHPLAVLLEACDIQIVDYTAREILLSEEALFTIASAVQAYFEDMPKMQGITRSGIFMQAAEHVTFFCEDYPLDMNTRFYHTAYGEGLTEELHLFVLPKWEKGGEYNAQIMQYGAVSEDSFYAEEGYHLLRALMDYEAATPNFFKYGQGQAFELSVRRDVLAKNLELAQGESGQLFQSGSLRVPIVPLPAKYAWEIGDAYERITSASLTDASAYALLDECMEPYLTQGAGYHECFDRFIDEMLLMMETGFWGDE